MIRFVNKAAEATFGHSAANLAGMNLSDLVAEIEIGSASGKLSEFSYKTSQATGIGKDGENFPIEISVGEYVLENEKKYICTVRNNTDKEQMEQRLRQSQKMEAVGQLAGGIAHDFNNVLTVILGNMELARESINKQQYSSAHERLKLAEEGAQRAAQFTRRLLIFSQRDIQAPKILNIADVIHSSVQLIATIIPENIVIRTELLKSEDVRVDFNQLQQVIINLIINARDALPNGGTIVIELSNRHLDQNYVDAHPDAKVGDYVLLSVSDDGTGIDPSISDRIFEPFFSTKEAGKGTGLGLATVYSVITGWQGHVSVYSEPGRGTTLRAYLPVTEFEGRQNIEAAQPPYDLTNPLQGCVLVCEDDIDVRRLLVALLSESGLNVLESTNAADALRISNEQGNNIDLLITDVVMPEMNGRELAEKVVADHPMHVLFVSGYTTNIVVHHGIVEEDINFLEKPFSRAQLLQTVRNILEGA